MLRLYLAAVAKHIVWQISKAALCEYALTGR